MRIVLLLAIVFATLPGLAAGERCNELGTPVQANHLPDVGKAALEVARVYCAEGSTPAEVTDAFKNFIRKNAGWFDPFGGFAGNRNPMVAIAGSMEVYGDDDLPAVGLTFPADGHDMEKLAIGDELFEPRDPDECRRAAGDNHCADVLDEFVAHYTYAQTAYAFRAREMFIAGVLKTGSEWDQFLTASRSFTLLELAANSYLIRRNESVDFEHPPDLQVVLLHPTIAIENVPAAVDGAQLQEAIVIDVLGVNWWRQNRWYVPSGFAVSYIYSDRPGVQDWGYGASLYFDSTFTIGYSNHDGDHGVFVSANLLKLFQDKQRDYRKLLARH